MVLLHCNVAMLMFAAFKQVLNNIIKICFCVVWKASMISWWSLVSYITHFFALLILASSEIEQLKGITQFEAPLGSMIMLLFVDFLFFDSVFPALKQSKQLIDFVKQNTKLVPHIDLSWVSWWLSG